MWCKASCATPSPSPALPATTASSTSPWASPIVMVKKKNGDLRFCIDYRKLNAVTEKDAYPLPQIDMTIEAFEGVRWFSTLDLTSGYWQVGMTEDAK